MVAVLDINGQIWQKSQSSTKQDLMINEIGLSSDISD